MTQFGICAQDNCGAIVQAPTRRCPEHAPPRSPSSRATSAPGWQKARGQVLKRDGHRCQIQLPGCTGEATVVDHIRSAADGGSNEITNLRASCQSCNVAVRPRQVRYASDQQQRRHAHETVVDRSLRDRGRQPLDGDDADWDDWAP